MPSFPAPRQTIKPLCLPRYRYEAAPLSLWNGSCQHTEFWRKYLRYFHMWKYDLYLHPWRYHSYATGKSSCFTNNYNINSTILHIKDDGTNQWSSNFQLATWISVVCANLSFLSDTFINIQVKVLNLKWNHKFEVWDSIRGQRWYICFNICYYYALCTCHWHRPAPNAFSLRHFAQVSIE